MDYILKKANQEDAIAVFELVKERMKWMDQKGIKQWNVTHYTDSYPLTHYLNHLNELYVLVNGTNEVAAGMIVYEQDDRWEVSNDAYYLHQFVAKINCKGAGKALMKEVEKMALFNGKKYLRLDSAVDNDKLTRYYENLGFIPKGEYQEGEYKGILREKLIIDYHE